MAKPRVIVLAGYGLNCEDETKFAFELAGASAAIVHINDLVSGAAKLRRFQVMAVPGGFSYGDDIGSGKAYANKLRNHLSKELEEFVSRDTLTAGICNGFQVLTNLNLLPGALTFNDNARYTDRWVDLKIEGLPAGRQGKSPWLSGIETLTVPIAHGEGKFIADEETLKAMSRENSVAARYVKDEICQHLDLPANPTGTTEGIASVTSHNGRVIGIMPHPERAMFFTQLPHWTFLKEKYLREKKKIPTYGPGLKIFKNAVRYFA